MIKVDTIKLRECGRDLSIASDSLKNNVNNLFARIEGVPTRTKEWVGEASTQYSNMVLREKNDYDRYVNNMIVFSNSLINYADELERAVKKTML